MMAMNVPDASAWVPEMLASMSAGFGRADPLRDLAREQRGGGIVA